MSSARARAARMAERSVLTASSKVRISSCSLSLSRWGSPTAAFPFGGSLGWMIDLTRPDGQTFPGSRGTDELVLNVDVIAAERVSGSVCQSGRDPFVVG